MTAPVRMTCQNPDCPACGIPDEVPGWKELGHVMPLLEEDEECPECGQRRGVEQ